MTTKNVRMPGSIAMIFVAVFLFVFAPAAPGQTLPNETPQTLTPTNDGFEYVRRDVMIPMRDGVKLHTVIIVPKGAKHAPILLTRTPYNATELTSHAASSHLGPILNGYDNAVEVIVEGGYIRVVQDVRGQYGSEGDYVMNRPLQGPLNPTNVDHATDTYDTIDWLVKNIPETNGIDGILAQVARASELRFFVARAGSGQDSRETAVESSGDAGPQPLGPGRHLWSDRGLQSDRTKGREQRQGVFGDGPLAPRSGDRRWQHTRGAEIPQRHRTLFSAAHSAPVPGSLLERRRAEVRRRAG